MAILVFALTARVPAQPVFRLIPADPQPAPSAGPDWLPDLTTARTASLRDGKPIVLYFTAKW